jgi:GT2 family glycosyltransferase
LRCLESLHGIETICVDNGSTDGTPDAVAAEHPEVEVIRTGRNLGYAAGNNVGIRRALERGADWVLLLNQDVVVEPGIAEALAEAARARQDAGVLACKVLFAHDPERIEYAGAGFNALLGYSGRQTGYGELDRGGDGLRDVGRATGAAMAVSRRAIEAAGLLDEDLYMYVEDVDWCLRIRAAGAAVVFVPDARVRHSGGSDGRFGRTSPTTFYYVARNTLAVAERQRPLPRGLRGARRLVILGTHLIKVRHDRDTIRAVLAGWRDYRAGRMGPRVA